MPVEPLLSDEAQAELDAQFEARYQAYVQAVKKDIEKYHEMVRSRELRRLARTGGDTNPTQSRG